MSRPALVCLVLLLLLVPVTISCGATVCFGFNTTPQIVSINPGVIVTGGSGAQITLVGSNFGNNIVIVLSDGTQIVPATIGPTRMTIFLGSSFFSSTGTIGFRVSNPCGGFSNTAVITVVDHF